MQRVTVSAPGGGQAVADDGAGLLAGLFPHVVARAVAPLGGGPRSTWPQEQALVAGAVPARRREFLVGRACAHAALRDLGLDAGPVGRGEARQPLWPPGVVGAISHGGGLVAAVAARAGEAWGLGLDLEPLRPPLDPAVDRVVRTRAERAVTASTHPLAQHLPKVVFCAKECVFKALFPATRWPLEFDDVTIEVDLRAGRWHATVDRRFRLDGRPLAPLAGGFAAGAGHLLAGLLVAH